MVISLANAGNAPAPADKPAILKSSEFTVEEGLAYRAMRTGAIWMNKLFFSSLILLVVWLALAAATHQTSCTDSYQVDDSGNGTTDHPAAKCSVFLTPTAKYLGAMAVLTFLASLAFGALGLVVGKRILEVAKASEELGAGAGGPPGDGSGEGDRPAEEP
ncbi:MAG: hypothetical protein QOJ26_1646 [Thermoplasmata archaeon]|jgi:hypothetical protein|nr:hypothetical protein [Thermoplasmata archaeon]